MQSDLYRVLKPNIKDNDKITSNITLFQNNKNNTFVFMPYIFLMLPFYFEHIIFSLKNRYIRFTTGLQNTV